MKKLPSMRPLRASFRSPAPLAAALCLGLSACAVGPDYLRPAVKLQDTWQHHTHDQQTQASLGDWWRQFNDPRLTLLLQQGRAQSPTLQIAALRIAQAQAQLGISQSGQLPVVQLSLSSNYNKPDLANQLQGKSGGSTSGQLSLQASWEPDLWGAVRRGVESDRASWLSTLAAYQAALVALDANIATLYFNVRTLEQRLHVAEDNLKQQAENLRIATARFHAGAASEQDMRQAQTLFEQTHANLPTLRAALEQSQHALSVLLGQAPDYYQRQFTADSSKPRVPPAIPTGIPRDLLQRRPDVLQAEYAAAAQSARIGQAKAALFPSFSLGGSFGFQSTNRGDHQLGDLFKWHDPVTTATASFLFPLFNHGQLVNQVRVQDASFQQAVLNYQNQVLIAQQEVEDALSSIEGNRTAYRSLTSARNAAQRSAVLALERYKAGETDFTTVTTANQAQRQVEDGLAQAEGNLLQSFVAAYRALGGGWDGTLTATLPPDITDTMRARTDWGDALDLPQKQRVAP